MGGSFGGDGTTSTLSKVTPALSQQYKAMVPLPDDALVTIPPKSGEPFSVA